VIRALKVGVPITEFPTREGQRVDGQTHFASIPTGIAELKLLGREIWMGVRTPGRLPPAVAGVEAGRPPP
jgi:hypothetical protein